MADHSAIEWTDASWNPLRGCSRVSTGCQHCYAERVAARFSGPGQPYEGLIHAATSGWNGRVRLVPGVLDQPLRWKRPRRIFVNSMSDLFHESMSNEAIAAVFGVMAAAPQHTFQILTKRPARMLEWFAWHKQAARQGEWEWQPWRVCEEAAIELIPGLPAIGANQPWPLRHVWVGVSVENQAAADERIPLLLQCPAAVRWLSCEPLLGPINFRWTPYAHQAANQPYPAYLEARGSVNEYEALRLIDWIVAGGESGPDARPMHPEWARSLRDQCTAAGARYFFKQWGEWAPHQVVTGGDLGGSVRSGRVRIVHHRGQTDVEVSEATGGHSTLPGSRYMARVGKRAAGRLLDGAEHNAYPGAIHE